MQKKIKQPSARTDLIFKTFKKLFISSHCPLKDRQYRKMIWVGKKTIIELQSGIVAIEGFMQFVPVIFV